MKNLELLPLPAESKKRIDEFARQYQRMGHISIEVVSYIAGTSRMLQTKTLTAALMKRFIRRLKRFFVTTVNFA